VERALPAAASDLGARSLSFNGGAAATARRLHAAAQHWARKSSRRRRMRMLKARRRLQAELVDALPSNRNGLLAAASSAPALPSDCPISSFVAVSDSSSD
jgi:hypothetical protein